MLRRIGGLMVLALSLSCSAGPEGVPWESYGPDVVAEATASRQPVMLNFHADWCIPCHELDEFTFSDPRVIESTAPFLRLEVDLTDYESFQSARLRQEYGVTGVPEILFLDGNGVEIRETRVIGFLGAEDFLRRVRHVLQVVKARQLLTLRSTPDR